MDFLPADLIRRKRAGATHTPDELRFLIQNYVAGRIADYQMSAWLMAVCFQGMTDQETAVFTTEMRDSGVTLDLSALGVTVDKHSTGGVGDKTSLILAPLVAAAGIPVPMMAGRGLGFTGGTLDKLESLRGFDVNLSLEKFKTQVRDLGAAIIGQTPEICPADRKLYALRDVTGTVDSLPLICGSIMSKKLAEGMSALVLDVKFGSGAFMKTRPAAESLARALKAIGEHAGKTVTALITSVQQPLGRFIGNALEVRECLDILQNKPAPEGAKNYDDTISLTLDLAAHMIHLGQRAPSVPAGRARAAELLADGSAYAKFKALAHAQGADAEQPLPRAASMTPYEAKNEGYVDFRDVEQLGRACIHLGAGRKFQGDALDFAAGLEVLVTQGQRVRPGEPLVIIHANPTADLAQARAAIDAALALTRDPVPAEPLVANILH